ncbi:MAG: flippase-like domain-containing protein, partial [Hyphomicrobiaceae bacterium]|nr:flippase-like domain-containing protein [Hyphomicrobiaceae bacterium]
GRTFGEAFLTVFIDRMWDLMFVLALGVVSVLVFSRFYMEIPSGWIVLTASLGIAVCVYLATQRALMRRLLKPMFDALVPKKYKEAFSLNFNTFYDSLALYRRDRGAMVAAFLLTVLVWALVFLLAYYITVLFGIDVDLKYVVLIMPIVTLVELIPISVSGLGTRDATVIYFFSVVGISSAAAVGFSIGYLFIGTYLTALAGFLMWLRHPVKLGA